MLVTTGTTVRGPRAAEIQKQEIPWEELVEQLSAFNVLDLSQEDYAKLSVEDKLTMKNSFSWLIGGYFDQLNTRKKKHLVARTLVTLDIDYADVWDVPLIHRALQGTEYVMHSTLSHTEDQPKLRVMLPVNRDVTPEEYEPLARRVAAMFDINMVDKVSYRPTQLMYAPAVCSDGTILFEHNPGNTLDPDVILALYDDWADPLEWPYARKDTAPRVSEHEAENPLTKPGVIGAFCRAYDIHQAIDEFDLPYHSTGQSDRYTPDGATGSEGAVTYDDLFLYSHHSNDPASNKNLNAWDLVRLCLYGELDAECAAGAGPGDLPSQKMMQQLAMGLPAVQRELAAADGMVALEHNEFDVGGVLDQQVIFGQDLLEHSDVARAIEGVAAATGGSQALAIAPEHDTAAPPEPVKPKLTLVNNELTIDALLAAAARTTDLAAQDKLILALAAANVQESHLKAIHTELKRDWPGAVGLGGLRTDVARKRAGMTGAHQADSRRNIELQLVDHLLNTLFNKNTEAKFIGRVWWQYHGGCWRPTETTTIARQVLSELDRLIEEQPKEHLPFVAFLSEGKLSGIHPAIMRLLEIQSAVRAGDNDPLQLCAVRGCVVNATNCELHWNPDTNAMEPHPHNPDSFFTTQISVPYTPEATDCPTWDAFCQDILFKGHKEPQEMQRCIEELGGYLVNMSRWQKTWVLFKGNTNSGKSTLTAIFGRLLGAAAAHNAISTYGGNHSDPHANYELVGKLMLLEDDFSKGDILPDGFIKEISESKMLTANKKYADAFSFRCQALPVIAANHWPRSRDVSDALKNRAFVVDCKYSLPVEMHDDKQAEVMLTKELPAIFNRFIAGLSRLRARGRWDYPEEMLAAREKWGGHSNLVAYFVRECVTRYVDSPLTTAVKSSDMYPEYQHWCTVSGGRAVGKYEFFERMGQMGFPRKKDSAGIYRMEGVKSVSQPE